MSSVRTDLQRGWRLRGDAAPVEFSIHSVQRAQERMSPRLDEVGVRRALQHMLATARVVKDAPSWLGKQQRADAWLVFGEDWAAPLYWRRGELRATTLMNRSAMSPTVRSHRNTVRASRTKGRMVAKRRGRGRGVGPAGPSAQDWDGDA
jgi:hypothetical protein